MEVFSDIIDSSSAEIPTPTSELDCFLIELVIDYKIGKPFVWWADHKVRFPSKVQVAKRYLSATATSVPSERLFSIVSSIYDDQRSRITAEHAESLLLLKATIPGLERTKKWFVKLPLFALLRISQEAIIC